MKGGWWGLHQEGNKVLHVLKGVVFAQKAKLQKLIQSLNSLKDDIVLLIFQ